jgi:hypothetical protein
LPIIHTGSSNQFPRATRLDDAHCVRARNLSPVVVSDFGLRLETARFGANAALGATHVKQSMPSPEPPAGLEITR